MANRFFSAMFVVTTLVVTLIGAQEADSPPASDQTQSSKEQLGAIQKEIESLRQQAARLSAQEDSIIATLAQFDVQYQIKSQEIELLQLKQEKTLQEIEALKATYQEQQSNLDRQKAYLTKRLVEAYKLGELNYLKLMLRVNKTADLLRTYQYITYLAKDDTRKVQAYRNTIDELEQTRLRLEQEDRNLALYRQDLESAHQALLRSRQDKLRLLAAIQDEKETHLSALGELRQAAGQLQNFFADASVPATSALPGTSVAKYKGFLDWPVRGQVVHGFGTFKHPKFGTTTMSNGIEIAAAEGTDVVAVFGGQVVFSELFKGYGLSIILSHSDGYYTLYSHNSQLVVQRGQNVQRGQVIAKVGSTGSLNGPSLYFEIRRRDQPLNPTDWLRRVYISNYR
jgi:septal ring factor EnvC (AmiA/AmiB activator)